jgi:parvulin-like peptidyl-prolyl isomerase
MEMKTRLLFAPLLLALVASLAACGGGSTAVPANAVAVVGDTPITTAEFTTYFNQAVEIAVHNGQSKPTPGSPQYTAMRDQVMAYLVQVTELEQQAPKEKVSVSDEEVTKYIQDLAKTSYGGSMAKLIKALKAQKITLETARQEVRVNLLAEKIHTKVTKSVKVTDAAAKAYYELNISNYQVGASTTRNVEYILFKCAPLGSTTCSAAKNRAEKHKADMVEQKLQNGANFEAMARQYSDDSTTAPGGGKYTLVKGGVVPAFGAAGFALKTGTISQPVDATSKANQGYGWFIIKALEPTVHTKAHTASFDEKKEEIKQTLSQQKVDAQWSQWLSDLKAHYEDQVHYQTGYAPPTTTALSTTN